jgi:hypothetical protein
MKYRKGKFDRVGVRGALVTTFHSEYPDGLVFPEHYHEVDQIVFASQGIMTVETPQGIWVLPASRALWIPCGVAHTVRMYGTVSARNLYFKPGLAPGMPRTCCVVNISPWPDRGAFAFLRTPSASASPTSRSASPEGRQLASFQSRESTTYPGGLQASRREQENR